MSIRLRLLIASALVLLLSAQRLPAPIQEVPETPTPAPTEEAKPKKRQSKSRTLESEPKTKFEARPSAPPVLQGPARFAGTWTGRINQGILGDVDVSLVINATGTSVREIHKIGSFTHPASINGNMMTWKAGWLNEIAWTFTPAGDGETAAVTSKSALGVNGAAIFRKQ